MKRIIVLILPIFFALSAKAAARSESHFIVAVQSKDETIEQLCDRLGLELVRSLDRPHRARTQRHGPGDERRGTYLVKASDQLSHEAVSEILRNEQSIELIEGDRRVFLPGRKARGPRTQNLQNEARDPATSERLHDRRRVPYHTSRALIGYVQQPATSLTRVGAAHRIATGAGTVAVIDTGVDPTHPVLKRSLIEGYDFIEDEPGEASEWRGLDEEAVAILQQSTVAILEGTSVAVLNQSTVAILEQHSVDVLSDPKYSAFGHGTMVAGIIHLVAPKAKIMPLRVFRADGCSRTSDIIRAIYYAVDNGANVINMSFSFVEFSPELMRAINFATRQGVVCVSSAGNEGIETLVYPASFANVLGVAATTNADFRSDISNYGEDLVSLAAPGEGIVTTYPGRNYAAGFGTSFSTPFVSGAVALLFEVDSYVDQYRAMEKLSHSKKLSPGLGYGRLDLYRALRSRREREDPLSNPK